MILNPPKNPSQRDPRRPLNIVVETGNAFAVAIEYLEGDVLVKVLPLQHRTRKNAFHTFDERFDEGVVLVTAQPAVSPPQIVGILQQQHVIGPHVQTDGQTVGRMDSGRGAVQRQFPDGNAHPASALVAQAQDALVVGRHDQPHIL